MTDKYDVCSILDDFCNREKKLQLHLKDCSLESEDMALEDIGVKPLAFKKGKTKKKNSIPCIALESGSGHRTKRKSHCVDEMLSSKQSSLDTISDLTVSESNCLEREKITGPLDQYLISSLNNGSPASNTRSSTRRNQRHNINSVAASSNLVDVIDLASSPVLSSYHSSNQVVSLDSEDDEEVEKQNARKEREQNLMEDDSFEIENAEMSIKIKWNNKIEIFKLRKHQKFMEIFKTIAAKEKCEVDHLVFNINNKVIAPSDTPNSINYKIYQFISGRVLITSPLRNINSTVLKKKKDKNQIKVKIQSDKWKRPIILTLNKTDTLKLLYIKCSEELNKQCKDFKLSFDGESLEISETPIAEYDLEGGEIIDCVIVNK